MRPAARALALALAALAVVFGAPAVASASVGSVPPEVRVYVTGGALVDRLEDLYGEGADGTGIPFDETTEPGTISRVFHWTAERLAGDLDGEPTRLVNEWAVPVTLAAEPVGVAIVWINTDTELPELAEFLPGADAAAALAEVPDAAQLVRDLGSGGWFALTGQMLTPLAPGASGITEPVPLDAVRPVAPSAAEEPAPVNPNAGLGVAIVAAVLLLGVVIAALLIPGRRRRASGGSAGDGPPAAM